MVKLSINDSKSGRVVMGIANNDKKGAQLQVIRNILGSPCHAIAVLEPVMLN